jgi:hydroxymethylglutaryl-CoA lyase
VASKKINVFEVGPRDGLQNEPTLMSIQEKSKLISGLVKAGLQNIEMGSFVRPDRVPQMADTDEIAHRIQSGQISLGTANAWYLVPNQKGLERALAAGVTHIAVFTAATDSFAQKNIGMSIQQSFNTFEKVIQIARAKLGKKLQIRGYVSTAFGCPFEGRVSPKKALKVVEKLANLGVHQISIGDTIGVATPRGVEQIIRPAINVLGVEKTAVHFHDTRGTALANALRSLDLGVTTLDSSAGGLGGCPFAPGAAGNLSTEDLVYLLDGMGLKTGINLNLLCQASLAMFKKMKRPLVSRYLQTYASTCQRSRKATH